MHKLSLITKDNENSCCGGDSYMFCSYKIENNNFTDLDRDKKYRCTSDKVTLTLGKLYISFSNKTTADNILDHPVYPSATFWHN